MILRISPILPIKLSSHSSAFYLDSHIQIRNSEFQEQNNKESIENSCAALASVIAMMINSRDDRILKNPNFSFLKTALVLRNIRLLTDTDTDTQESEDKMQRNVNQVSKIAVTARPSLMIRETLDNELIHLDNPKFTQKPVSPENENNANEKDYEYEEN